MIYSEKTQRELDKYTRSLVRKFPAWLRRLFDEDKIFFGIEEQGDLAVYCSDELEEKVKVHAGKLINKFLHKYPCKAIKPMVVQ